MGIHFLDPDREPRFCDGCAGTGGYCEHGMDLGCYCSECRRDVNPANVRVTTCPECNGTGRLGVEGAAPDVEVTTALVHSTGRVGYQWSLVGPLGERHWHGIFPTESAALAAAREENS